ncbi:hypothetical protein [Lactobacillus sp. PV012]|uniref:hypothetical protein n=1 Tax=Lactobacillus sp. PV012 TaxID=2594494 RepID=UPI002240AC8C|nr:hypothetical protein [Lactobacillus sp. PV012]QNQ81577.1 hypothetical protein FP433_00180 [Lactobacillus sp. PV012]
MMLKKKLVVFSTLLGLTGVLSSSISSAHAATIDITDDMPSSGSVVIEGQKIKESSSPLFVAPKKRIQTSTPWFTVSLARDVVNMKNGRWVSYTDHNNYFNHYKWSHSNFYYTLGRHHSSAKVGSGKIRTAVGIERGWSYATAKGYGTAKTWYSEN